MTTQILLQPLGHLPKNIMQHLQKTLAELFPNTTFDVPDSIEIPKHCYNKSRNQYISPEIIYWIDQNCKQTHYHKILGVADVNAYTGRLNFVFGEAQFGRRICVIYIARLKEVFAEGESLFLQRTVKEAVHELGHTFGLLHCQNTACVMYFSNTLADTDQKAADLCGCCKLKVGRNFF